MLEHASFHIHQGEFIALAGPNGSGKTTILKLVLGLEKPGSGRIQLFGGDCAAGRKFTGYVPQNAAGDRDFPITLREVIRMGTLRPLSRRLGGSVEEAMAAMEIQDLAERPFSALSGGQRRRALVARALAARPRLLLMDEPAANMDAESEERLSRTLGRLKGETTILLVTHDTSYVSSLIDRVLCLGGRGGVVQHRTEAAGEDGHGSPPGAFRIIHREEIPGDSCDNGEGG